MHLTVTHPRFAGNSVNTWDGKVAEVEEIHKAQQKNKKTISSNILKKRSGSKIKFCKLEIESL
jgi:hypothetical protein